MTGRPFSEALAALSFVVDRERRVVESNAAAFLVGELLIPSAWLGQQALDALSAAEAGRSEPFVGRDYARDTHWLVQAAVEAPDPWRARVVIVDATLAVSVDRRAILGRLVHAMRNSTFALQSVVQTIRLDRPTGAELDMCLKHVRDPADRISATMLRLAALAIDPLPESRPVTLAAIVDEALARVAPTRVPETVDVHSGEEMVSGDTDLLSETVAAMLESGGEDAPVRLEVNVLPVGRSPHAQFVVDRRASPPEVRAGLALWDVAAGFQFDVSSRLAVGRAVVLAHGGDVSAESPRQGRIRLGIRLPLLSAR